MGGRCIRLTPSLDFFADAIPETAAHLEDLLKEARERDAAVAAAAAAAQCAGEADPYRNPRPGTTWPTRPPVWARRMSAPDGLLVVDKPAGWTSHDVVAGQAAVRHPQGPPRRHPRPDGDRGAGIGVNKATRLLTFLVGSDKAYTATIRLGQSTITDDAEVEVVATAPPPGWRAEAPLAAVALPHRQNEQMPS